MLKHAFAQQRHMLMQATFLSHERKPEVNISRARVVVSPSIVYKCVKRNLIGKRLIFCRRLWLKNVACLSPLIVLSLGGRGGERGLRGCRESCYHKQGVALYRRKAKGDNLVCWRDNTGAINAFYVSCSMYILKFKERRINQGIILRVFLSFQCNERFTQALAQFKLPWLFSPSSVTNHYSLSDVRPIL